MGKRMEVFSWNCVLITNPILKPLCFYKSTNSVLQDKKTNASFKICKFLLKYVTFIFWQGFAHMTGWPRTSYVFQAGLENTHLTQSPLYLDWRHVQSTWLILRCFWFIHNEMSRKETGCRHNFVVFKICRGQDVFQLVVCLACTKPWV